MQFPHFQTAIILLLASAIHGCPYAERGNYCQCVYFPKKAKAPVYAKDATKKACAAYPHLSGEPAYSFDERLDLCWDKAGSSAGKLQLCINDFQNGCGGAPFYGNCVMESNDKNVLH
ncbi:hypothetical protein EJ03DRAFT_323035 [Teratosphaeria nubilosa]|uniref:Extracellular membrane protein CFEM domain-containing protein n=1 Tax=Teratosphaeria nubilosa TaxID=161662 RepID=A0A6G1LNG7_9PEZI|nr:hypothetical protein EJ03DRAFT_323035 [Teratosphaeria nubilosa]